MDLNCRFAFVLLVRNVLLDDLVDVVHGLDKLVIVFVLPIE